MCITFSTGSGVDNIALAAPLRVTILSSFGNSANGKKALHFNLSLTIKEKLYLIYQNKLAKVYPDIVHLAVLY